jgi:hypothetical protein
MFPGLINLKRRLALGGGPLQSEPALGPPRQPLEPMGSRIVDAVLRPEGRDVPPKSMDAVLKHLPLRIGAYVPDDILEDWFAPGTGMKPASDQALSAAKTYGWRFECEFKYYPERMEGVFWKWVPAI